MMKHAERFTGRAAGYEKYRVRYPVAVIEILTARCGLQREDLVADIGAGTGMLSELFLENGNAVVAVEPNDEMRAVCEQLASAWPGLTVEKATAEATGLDSASVDFVAVGRAWHWFDRERAVAEFRRVLKPGGWVALVSNRRYKDGSEEYAAYEAILTEFGDGRGETERETRRAKEIAPLFGEGAVVVREELRGEQMLTLEEFLGQTQSFSVAPLPVDAKYEGMQTALRDFFARFQQDGVLRMGTLCSVMACQVSCRA
ncbi:class I SAM-dependent methyltransferase [Tunturiibacter lichenicola]|jgi:SAM-dependent methyltransferase|uniref:class I SAM-dependent methyltransferase n=1 Tax=Tunturiibacter lichenicola TaxID=2051959 RepID=UPI003D9AD9F5